MQKVEFDYSKLKGRIREKCDTQDAFALKLNLGRVTLSQRLNNQSYFSQDEIMRACRVLDITGDEMPVYFFTARV